MDDLQLSDAEGRFRFNNVPVGEYILSRGSTPRVPSEQRQDWVHLTVDEHDVVELSYPIEPGIKISGVVVDAGLQPVRDAVVSLYTGDYTLWRQNTNAFGEFAFENFQCRQLAQISAASAVYGRAQATLVHYPCENQDMVLQLSPALNLHGKLVEVSGEPVSGATVNGGSTSETISDADGRFTISGIPWSSYRVELSVHKGGYQYTILEPGAFLSINSDSDHPVEVCVEPELSILSHVPAGEAQGWGDYLIEGRVLNQQREPVEGAHVSEPDMGGSDLVVGGDIARTDVNGNFRLMVSEPGDVVLCARQENYSVGFYKCPAPASGVFIVLKPHQNLDVLVLDALTHQPIPRGRIALDVFERDENPFLNSYKSFAYCSVSGCVSMSTPYPRMHTIAAMAEGYAPGFVDVSPNEAAAPLYLHRDAPLTGIVRDSAGAPIPSAWVLAYPGNRIGLYESGKPYAKTQSRIDGVFRLVGLPDGEYTLSVKAPDHYPLMVYVPNARAAQPFDFTMRGSGSISGTATKNGEPLRGLQVKAVNRTPLAPYEVEHYDVVYTEADGSFVLDVLAPGVHEIFYSRDGDHYIRHSSISVSEGSRRHLDIRIK